MIAWTVAEPETSLGFPFSLLFFITSMLLSIYPSFPSSLAPVVTVTTRPSSLRCLCRTRHAHGSLTPSHSCPSQPRPRVTTDAGGEVSLWPLTSRSARPTATVLNMDALSESPSESTTPWLCLCVCVFAYFMVIVWRKETTLTPPCVGGQRMEKGRVKMEDSVIDEIHLKCIIEWKEMSRSPCYSNEARLYQISGLSPDGTFQCVQKGIWRVLFNFFLLIVLLHSGWTQTASVQMWKTPFMLEIRFSRSTGRPFTTFLWMRYLPHCPSHIVNILLYCKYANGNHGVLNCPVVEEGKVLILALS